MRTAILTLILCSGACWCPGQTVQVDKNTGRLYSQPFKGSLVQQLIPDKPGVQGSPYWLEQASGATLYTDGKAFNEEKVLIDLDRQIIIYSTRSGNFFVEANDVDSILYAETYHLITDPQLGVMERVFQYDKRSGFVRKMVSFKEANYRPQFDQGSKYDQWVSTESYYVKTEEGIMHEVSRLKDFRSFLSDSEYDALKGYGKSHQINKLDRAALIELLQFLQSM